MNIFDISIGGVSQWQERCSTRLEVVNPTRVMGTLRFPDFFYISGSYKARSSIPHQLSHSCLPGIICWQLSISFSIDRELSIGCRANKEI